MHFLSWWRTHVIIFFRDIWNSEIAILILNLRVIAKKAWALMFLNEQREFEAKFIVKLQFKYSQTRL